MTQTTQFGRFTILTKFRPATEHNPARVYATCTLGKAHICYPFEGEEKSHLQAAQALLEKLNITKVKLIGGYIQAGQYAFIVLEK